MAIDLRNKKVIIADSSKIVQVRLHQMFLFHKVQVFVADTGNEAVSKAISLNPDLMIVSLSMPDMSGLDIIRSIRNFTSDMQSVVKMRDIPIIVLASSSLSDSEEKRLHALGVIKVFIKPLNLGELESLSLKILNGEFLWASRLKVILCVDGEARVRQFYKSTLEVNEDYEVVTVEDGFHCLEQVEFKNPDVILMELNLPDMPGLELLQSLKEVRPDIPVVVVTSVTDEETKKKAMEIGAYDYITKPFDLDELRNKLRTILSQEESKEEKVSA